jgi:hypothetical protein
MFIIYLNTKFHISDSLVTITKPKAEVQINGVIKQKEVKKTWEAIRYIARKMEPITVIKSEEWIKRSYDLFTYLTNLCSAWTWCYKDREWCK